MIPTEALLEVRDLHKSFGGLVAVNSVNFTVERGEILALIGPNGAGKTTIFNLLSGAHRTDSGQMLFEGQTLEGLRPSDIARLGLVRTFQNLQIFNNMSVLENVMVGCHLHGRTGFLAAAVRWPGTAVEEASFREQALACLELVGLAGRADDLATSLPFGQQRLVEIARALAVRPKLLLLDEPAAGLTRVEAEALDVLIDRIRQQGITVFLVEHDMNLVMAIADRVIVLQYGTKIAQGTPVEVQSNPAVIGAYLGAEWQIQTVACERPAVIDCPKEQRLEIVGER
jgi:ABC-type branched-subunit amino acid transport system ATPase component